MDQLLFLLNAATIGITLLCLGVLITKRCRIHPNQYLLAGFLLCFLLQQTVYLMLLDAAYIDLLRFTFRLPFPAMLLAGPLIYVFFRNVLERRSLRPTDALFALPALLVLIDQMPLYLLEPQTKGEFLQRTATDPLATLPAMQGLLIPAKWHVPLRYFYNLPFVLMALRLYWSHRNEFRSLASNSRSVVWYGLLLLPVLMFVVSLVLNPGILTLIANRVMDAGRFDVSSGLRINSVASSIMLLWICTLVLANQEILFTVNKARVARTIDLLGMTNSMQLLERLFEEESIHLDPKLRLADVAKRLKMDGGSLSASLNAVEGVNFNAYVNRWRIRHAKERLARGEQREFTIETIAETSGFASRSSFYNAFKAEEGMTPGEYIKKLGDTPHSQ